MFCSCFRISNIFVDLFFGKNYESEYRFELTMSKQKTNLAA